MIDMAAPNSQATVLNGGGALGICWQSGLLAGLEALGLPLADADLVVGSSAGAVVGAWLCLREDPKTLLTELQGFGAVLQSGGASAAQVTDMFTLMADAANDEDPVSARRTIGKAAAEATTASEDAYVGALSSLNGKGWPANYICTAVDIDTGGFQVWDADSAVDLAHAVAASGAAPTIFPVVTIHGKRYMDGGLRSNLNAHLAAGAGRVIVISCLPIEPPPGQADLVFNAAVDRSDLAALREHGSVVDMVEPSAEFYRVGSGPMGMMDLTRAEDAFAIGVAQAAQEVGRLTVAWSIR